jgi:hypothetical protein
MPYLRELEVRYKLVPTNIDIIGKKLESVELVYSAFNFLKYEAK